MFTPVRPPHLIRRFYKDFTWRLPGEDRKVFLTFDDGPIPGVTDFVLDTLSDFKIKATFFCIGNNVKNHPDLYKRIIESGHKVGNHTFQHSNGWLTSTESYLKDVADAEQYIDSDLFRPPYGRIKKSQAENLLTKYRIIMWDVLSYDWDPSVSPDQCLKNVILNTRPGSIIVFHDSLKATVNVRAVLRGYLEFLRNNNFYPESLP